MNKKEKVLEIVNDVITEKITGLIEEMSTNEFVEMIGDMYFDQTGKNIEDDTDDEINTCPFTIISAVALLDTNKLPVII